jgi:hypothetical protein
MLFKHSSLVPFIANGIRRAWGGGNCFISVEALTDETMDKSTEVWLPGIFSDIQKSDLQFTAAAPLMLLESSGKALSSAYDLNRTGLMVVCDVAQLAEGDLKRRLLQLSKVLGLTPQSLDILLKLDGLSLEATADDASAITDLIEEILEGPGWRSFTIRSSSFPKKLPMSRRKIARLPRSDIRAFQAIRSVLRRDVHFSDFPAENSVISTEKTGGLGRPIEHFRYLGASEHIISGGRGASKNAAIESIRSVAERLIAEADFRGADFSKGDAFIASVAAGYSVGRPTHWRQASVNHHIVQMIEELGFVSPKRSASPEPLQKEWEF